MTRETLEISTQQLNEVNEYVVPLSKARQSVEMQKQSVTDLKNSLNNTGNKDNEINIKLRELQNDRKKCKLIFKLRKKNIDLENNFYLNVKIISL